MINDQISLAVVQKPEIRWPGRLLEIQGPWAELALDSRNSIAQGDLVEFETAQTLYLGEVEWSELLGGEQRVRVHLEHSLDLEKTSWIQKLWNGQ